MVGHTEQSKYALNETLLNLLSTGVAARRCAATQLRRAEEGMTVWTKRRSGCWGRTCTVNRVVNISAVTAECGQLLRLHGNERKGGQASSMEPFKAWGGPGQCRSVLSHRIHNLLLPVHPEQELCTVLNASNVSRNTVLRLKR